MCPDLHLKTTSTHESAKVSAKAELLCQADVIVQQCIDQQLACPNSIS